MLCGWNIFGAVLSLNAAPRCARARQWLRHDGTVIKNKHLGQTGDRQFCLTSPLRQGLGTWLITKRRLAYCWVIRLGFIVCWHCLLNFSISFDSFTSLLTLISDQLWCLCSMNTGPLPPRIANRLRHVRYSQSSWNMDNFHTFTTDIQSCVLLWQVG